MTQAQHILTSICLLMLEGDCQVKMIKPHTHSNQFPSQGVKYHHFGTSLDDAQGTL